MDQKEIQSFLSTLWNKTIDNITFDKEAHDYFGCDFELNERKIKFRKAKVTPKKEGLFVTLWKRNSNKITEPYHIDDDTAYYIIAVEERENSGLFIFPKTILEQQHILSNHKKEGKRGFRIYPTWSKTANKQAQQSQKWQIMFFVNLNQPPTEIQNTLSGILK